DAAAAVGGTRGDGGNALHPCDGALDRRGDLAIDGLGGGPGKARGHGEGRPLDAWQFAHLDADESGETGDDDEGVDDHRQHRSADKEPGNGAAALVLAGYGHTAARGTVRTPLPASPTRGEVSAGGRGWIVPRTRCHTLPLVGRAGEGVEPSTALIAPHHQPRTAPPAAARWRRD